MKWFFLAPLLLAAAPLAKTQAPLWHETPSGRWLAIRLLHQVFGEEYRLNSKATQQKDVFARAYLCEQEWLKDKKNNSEPKPLTCSGKGQPPCPTAASLDAALAKFLAATTPANAEECKNADKVTEICRAVGLVNGGKIEVNPHQQVSPPVAAALALHYFSERNYPESLRYLMELQEKDPLFRATYLSAQRVYAFQQKGQGAVGLAQ